MPLEIRGAHFLIRSAQLVRKTRLEIGPGMLSFGAVSVQTARILYLRLAENFAAAYRLASSSWFCG